MNARRSQSGATLIELLMGLSITAIIFVPLMAWVALAIQQLPVTEDGLIRTGSTGLLASSFPRDVSIAGKAAVSGQGIGEPWTGDCGAGQADNGSVQLVLVTGGSTVQKIVYTVADLSDGGPRDSSRKSIWRRVCGAGADNTIKSEQELFVGVAPGSTQMICTSELGDRPCRQIELRTTPTSNPRPVVVRATRRVDEASVPTDINGDPLPMASIELLSRSGTQPMTATFSAAASSVAPGRSITTYTWEFGPNVAASSLIDEVVTAEFPVVQSYTVLLTVTDDRGARNTTFFQISSANAPPVAVIAPVTPDPVIAGSTVDLSSAGSFDPDGAILSFDWRLTLPDGEQVLLGGPRQSWVAPAGQTGTVDVLLTVTDAQLGRSTAFSSFGLNDPAVPPATGPPAPTIPSDPSDPTVPSDPTQLVAAFADSPGPSGPSRTFDASGSSGIGEGQATYLWLLGDGTSTATGPTFTHSYPNAGEYQVRLDVSVGERTATTARVVNVGGAPPAPTGLRREDSNLFWEPVAGARLYLVDFEFRTVTGCYRALPRQLVGPSATPSKVVPDNPCTGVATVRARVATDANGAVSWSGWIEFLA